MEVALFRESTGSIVKHSLNNGAVLTMESFEVSWLHTLKP